MQKEYRKKQSSFILCLMLTLTMALSVSGCNGKAEKETPSAGQQTESQADTQSDSGQKDEQSASQSSEDSSDAQSADDQAGDNVRGEGKTQFDFTVVDQDGGETSFEIHTDKEIVGEALQELGLIEGEEGEYGLFVKTVNGITADYDKDGVYWAFYVNDEYAQAGVDSTEITEGDRYAFKVE